MERPGRFVSKSTAVCAPRAVACAVLALLVLEAEAGSSSREESKMQLATGEFEVSLEPRALDGATEEEDFGRLSLDKTFHGDLAGASHGQMLSAGRPPEGAASYVALERFRGSLDGRSGSFVLLHVGTMHAGQQQLRIEVAAGSGTGELQGLTGTMSIRIEDGRHEYELRYTLP